MARDIRMAGSPLAEDFDVGDDSDLPGFDQPITQDDIDAIRNAPEGSIEQRRDQLLRMLGSLQARQGMDDANEFDGLIAEIEGAMADLDLPADGIGVPGAYAFDPDDRALAPDEIMEREEEEAERVRAEGG